MSHGYEYGNARLRARHAALLGSVDFDRLMERDTEGQLAVLARTPWRQAVEEASTRFSGLRCVQEAARRHLARALRDVRSLYEDRPREQVDALLSAWDRRNLLTLLRAAAGGRPSDDAAAAVVPAGALDEAALRALALAGPPKAVIDLLVTWGEPAGRALLAAWPAYVEGHDLAVLEAALVRWSAADLDARRIDLEPIVATAIDAELARDEVLLAVRLRAARESGEELVASPEWVASQDRPGGILRPRDLWDVVRLPSRAEAARVLATRPGLGAWDAPLRAWGASGDNEVLASALDRALHDRRIALRYHSDPLGPGPMVAYIEALETEARNVRVIAAGRAAGLGADEIRTWLWET